MQQFKKYDKYKDSGLEWLGDVPSDWKVRRAKDYSTVFAPDRDKPELNYESGKPWVTIDLLQNSSLDYSKVSQYTNDNTRTVPKNSIIASCVGEFSKTSIVSKKVVINQQIQAYTQLKENICFINYYIQSDIAEYYFNQVSTATTLKYINKDKFGLILTPLPPLLTQIKIAEFLDTQTTTIDAEIGLLTTKAAKYKQLKQSLINQVVTKGLNQKAEMKDTGIDWIGSIPSGWKVRRLKDLYKMNMGNTILKDDLIEGGKIPVYSASADDKYFGFVNSANVILNKGDLIICARGSIGHPKIVKELCTSTQTTISCKRKNKHFDPKFVHYYTLGFSDSIFYYDKTAIPQFTVEDANYIPIILPPKAEQVQITEYLDAKTGEIDSIITTINDKISKLKQYRKVLINDVVTGKINVE